MNKTWLILRYELMQTLRRRSFIIMTMAFPLIALIAIGGYQAFQGIESPPEEALVIGYIDETGAFTGYTEQPGEPEVYFVSYLTAGEATQALIDEKVSEYIIIPNNYLETGLINRFTLNTELELPGDSWTAVRNFLLDNLLEDETSLEITERAKNPAFFYNVTLDETGQPAEDQGGVSTFLLPFIFALLLLMAIFTSSGFLLQGLGEEKENRVMEILLSSVSARQLITGKVLGLGAAGLAQMVFWVVSALFIVNLLPSGITDIIGEINLSPGFVALSLVYFILGYLLFGILMAGAGALGANARESQQFSVIFTLPAALPMYALAIFINNPDHILAHILTLVPVTAPITVMMRLGLGEIPTWEIVLSMVLMVATIIIALWLTAKIFRSFLLMYGKTPRWGEIFRRLREA